jgi:hypothetical protein
MLRIERFKAPPCSRRAVMQGKLGHALATRRDFEA